MNKFISICFSFGIAFTLLFPHYINAQADTPNILVFLIDDLDEASFDVLLDQGKLPNIQQYLVNDGTRFTNSFVSNSICCPSRATMLTGKYSHNNKVFNVMGDESGVSQFIAQGNESENLAPWLKAANYQNAYLGKFIKHEDPNQILSGWDEWQLVEGYDARPRQYLNYNGGAEGPQRPDWYQTKFVTILAMNWIREVTNSSNPFFTVVAPRAVHIAQQVWKRTEIDGGNDAIPGENNQVVAFDEANIENGRRKQTIIRLSDQEQYTIYIRIHDGNVWGDWMNTGASILAGTGTKPIAGFTQFTHQDGLYRQQLIRGTQQGGYDKFYRINGGNGWSGWSLVDADWQDDITQYPIVGFSVYKTADNTLRQEIIRGNWGRGYTLVYRVQNNSSSGWSTWKQAPLGWDSSFIAPVFLPISAYNAFPLDNQTKRIQLVKQIDQSFRQIFYSRDEASFYDSSVLGLTSDSNNSKDIFTAEEDIEYLEASSVEPNGLVDNATSQRTYADGNWENVQAHQTFDVSLYPDDRLPAGSLRQDGPDGFIPISPEFDLPGIVQNKASYNLSGCEEKQHWYCENWLDLSNVVFENITIEDFVRRQHLDRLETMLSVDVMIGKIFEELRQMNQLDNTLVLFTSDNGYFLGDHRMNQKIAPQEESIRVPFIIRPPASITTSQVQFPVSNIDIAPTILDYSGLDWQSADYAVDGRSLRPLIEGNVTNWRNLVFLEHRHPRPLNSSRIQTFTLADYSALRLIDKSTQNPLSYTYVRYQDDPITTTVGSFEELYDLKDDPFQVDNLLQPSDQYKTEVQTAIMLHLQQELQRFESCSGATCRQIDQIDVKSIIPTIILTPTHTPTPVPMPADIEPAGGDGDVDQADYQVLVNAFDTSNTTADITPDGQVNIFDFNLLATDFGQ